MKAILLIMLVGLLVASSGLFAQQNSVNIGAGGVTGVYYQAGNAICRLLNRFRKKHGIRCSAVSTGGSVYDLEAIRDQKLDMAIVRSDWQYQAYKGTGEFERSGPNKELRALFSVQPMPFTLVARAGLGVKTFANLRGKRIYAGPKESSRRKLVEAVLFAKNLNVNYFELASGISSTNQIQALCRNEVDAVVFIESHPNSSIKEVTNSCNTVIVEVAGPDIDNLVEGNTYLRKATVPGGMYPGTDSNVSTFGLAATLVSSTNTSNEVAYWVTRSIFENLDNFRRLHPAFTNLKREEMIGSGQSAPLHDGAIRYYRESGLM